MSHTVHKQLLSMTDTLIRANKALKINLPKAQKKKEGIIQLLSDCQDSAISIGENVEKLYGEGTKTVAELEVYCENLYQMTLVLDNPVQTKELLKSGGWLQKKCRIAWKLCFCLIRHLCGIPWKVSGKRPMPMRSVMPM